MRKQFNIFLYGALLLCLIPINVIAQTYIERVPVDSIRDGEYLAVKYHIPFDTFNRDNDYGYQYEIYLEGEMIYKSALHPFISIGEHDHGFLQDLNKDGKAELKVHIASGGNNGAEDVYIYSIDSAVVLINALDGMNKVMPRFRDIDRDSIPEIIFNDNLFLCWHTGCAGSPRMPLIWRWDGERYRLANFKFKDYIIKGFNSDPVELRKGISSYVENYSFRKGYDPYPPALWKAMLQQIYAGNSNVADSIFNNFWPPELSDKNEFYLEFINHLHNGPYWEELQQSDW